MEIKKIKSTSKQLELEITGENETMLNPLTQILLRYDDVEYATIMSDHPTSPTRRLFIHMKKGAKMDPFTALEKAIKEITKELKDFRTQFEGNIPSVKKKTKKQNE